MEIQVIFCKIRNGKASMFYGQSSEFLLLNLVVGVTANKAGNFMTG
jgi:hypothetical protein